MLANAKSYVFKVFFRMFSLVRVCIVLGALLTGTYPPLADCSIRLVARLGCPSCGVITGGPRFLRGCTHKSQGRQGGRASIDQLAPFTLSRMAPSTSSVLIVIFLIRDHVHVYINFRHIWSPGFGWLLAIQKSGALWFSINEEVLPKQACRPPWRTAKR